VLPNFTYLYPTIPPQTVPPTLWHPSLKSANYICQFPSSTASRNPTALICITRGLIILGRLSGRCIRAAEPAISWQT
jgi:hypothetical protein